MELFGLILKVPNLLEIYSKVFMGKTILCHLFVWFIIFQKCPGKKLRKGVKRRLVN